MLTFGALSGAAVAGEFDVLAEPTPSAHYYVDDANVMSKSTRSEVDVRLKTVEVGGGRTEGPPHGGHAEWTGTGRCSPYPAGPDLLELVVFVNSMPP